MRNGPHGRPRHRRGEAGLVGDRRQSRGYASDDASRSPGTVGDAALRHCEREAATTTATSSSPSDEHGHVDGWDFWWGAARRSSPNPATATRSASRTTRCTGSALPATRSTRARAVQGPLDHQRATGRRSGATRAGWAGRYRRRAELLHARRSERAAAYRDARHPGRPKDDRPAGSARRSTRGLPPAARQRRGLGAPDRRAHEGSAVDLHAEDEGARRCSPAAPGTWWYGIPETSRLPVALVPVHAGARRS